MLLISHAFGGRLRPSVRKTAAIVSVAAALTLYIAPQTCAFLGRPRGARRTAEEAARRMLALSTAYQGQSTLELGPAFLDDRWLATPSTPRNAWLGIIHTDREDLELVMNDRTGNLVQAFGGGRCSISQCARPHVAPIETPAEAAKLSVQSVRSLQMIPAQSQIALAGIPTLSGEEKIWRVTWRVRPQHAHASYDLKVALYQEDGRLLFASNESESRF